MVEPDPLLARVDVMNATMHDLAIAIKDESAKRTVGNRIIGALLVVALAAAGIGIYSAYSTRATADCINDWSNAYQSRVTALASTSTSRTDALADYDLAVSQLAATIPGLLADPHKPGVFNTALAKLLASGEELERVDHDYMVALHNHPLDKVAAKLTC